MEIGFETIGNATLICHDRTPVLVTDPWVTPSAYFGSWGHSHAIPNTQMDSILASKYVWFSHGHPDHLNPESLPLFKGKKILLPDHFGGRIRQDLEGQGFDVTVLSDGKIFEVSENVRIICLTTQIQDAILLVDVNGRMVVNSNDAGPTPEILRFIRAICSAYSRSFLLRIKSYGDPDMINFLDDSGQRIPLDIQKRKPIGRRIMVECKDFGPQAFIPFSSMHRYQRHDSAWANEYTLPLSDYADGLDPRECELLPAFISYNCEDDTHEAINPQPLPVKLYAPEDFGDSWSDQLESEDLKRCENYFKSFSKLYSFLKYICVRVGGKDHYIDLGGSSIDRGIVFEAPRNSFMTSIQFEIFDDLLVGNFMKTTLQGAWEATNSFGKHYSDFNFHVAKYGDNGRAKTPDQLERYFLEYARRREQLLRGRD